jgi:hypothetical protein
LQVEVVEVGRAVVAVVPVVLYLELKLVLYQELLLLLL